MKRDIMYAKSIYYITQLFLYSFCIYKINIENSFFAVYNDLIKERSTHYV